ncbi:hypothetical protein GW17_00044856 [Ensete ventricosum]|nr:hypothetical protein GW17_00044856 [Ensete ventricosum]
MRRNLPLQQPLFHYPHCAVIVALRRRRHYIPSAWAVAPAASAAALERHLAGERCHLTRALPLQERSPLQAATLAAGAAYSRRRRPYRRQPCPWATAYVAAAPARGFGRGRPPPCKGPWPQPAWPWVSGPVWGLVVAGRLSSSLPSL